MALLQIAEPGMSTAPTSIGWQWGSIWERPTLWWRRCEAA